MVRINKLYLFIPVILIVAGCTTTNSGRKTDELEIRLTTLESRLNSIEQRQGLEEIQPQQDSDLKGDTKAAPGYKVNKLSGKDIQRALKNANFYDGPIDGRIGKNTRRAIKEFQKANGLRVDGIIGKETKQKLIEYLKTN